MMKSISWFFLIVFLIVFLKCNNTSEDHLQKQILRVPLIDNPTNLDPRTHSDVSSFRVIEQVYDFLVRWDSTGIVRPELAESWTMPSDTIYIFNIRKGIRFHDGMPLTAYDVAYTYESILDPALNAPVRSTLEVIDKITVLDSFHVKFKLKQIHAPFLSDIQLGIVPAHIAKNNQIDLKKHPFGSGPFKFVRWKADAFIELEKNEDYWKQTPRINKIVMKILPESNTRVLALENSEIDFLMNDFPQDYLSRLRENPRLKANMKTGSNYTYLALNLRNEYLKHQKVRLAIAHAINVKEMINDLMGGIPSPAKSLLNPDHWAYDPKLESHPFNPELANWLLDLAGFPDPDRDGPRFRFTLIYKCTDKLQSRQKAQVIQQYLRKVGINVNIQSYEWGTFFDDVRNGRFDLYSLSYVGIYEPDFYFRLFHSESIEAGTNRVAYQNSKIDKLINASRRITDFAKRKELYYQIQQILNEDLPFISLWYEKNIAIMDKHLYGFRIYPAGEWKSFYQLYFSLDPI